MSTSDNPSQSEGEQKSQQSVQQQTSQQESENQSAVTAAGKASDTSTADVARVNVILGLIFGLAYLLEHPEVRLFTSLAWWWLAVTAVVVLVLVLIFLPHTRKWLGLEMPATSFMA